MPGVPLAKPALMAAIRERDLRSVSAVFAALTFLPALLVLPGRTSSGEHGRWMFWPGVPHVGSAGPESTGVWARVAALVGRRSVAVGVLSALFLLVLAGIAWLARLR